MTHDYTKSAEPGPPTSDPQDAPPVQASMPSPTPIGKTPGVAITSLVLAILGFTCLGPLGFLPAIICGHVGLGKIKRAAGSLGGRGLALSGTIIGYVGLALSLLLLPLYLAMVIPAVSQAKHHAVNAQHTAIMQQAAIICIVYAEEHDGNMPTSLEDAMNEQGDNMAYMMGDDGFPRFEIVFTGNLRQVADPSSQVILRATQPSPGGLTLVAFADGHVEETQ